MKKNIEFYLLLAVIAIISFVLFIPVIKNINYGIDLQGGFEVIYKIEPLKEDDVLKEEDLNNTYEAITRRIDTLGVSEPVISFEGDDIIRISLPGVEDEETARERISTMAVLTFRDSDDNLLMTSDVLGNNGANYEYDSSNLTTVVTLDIKNTETFYKITKEISKRENNIIVIWLDYNEETDSYKNESKLCGTSDSNCISAATVEEGLKDSNIVIRGNFTKEEASELATLINSGSLPTKLVEESSPHLVSASFGQDTIKKAGLALVIAIVLISILMSIRYKISGVISSVCLILYTLLVFVVFNAIGGVFTLTGIAALILGIGMSIDSSVILIEKIKDEYKNSKNLNNSYKNGSKESLFAIIDANITTLLVAIVLYIFGESSIKGFATMLIISICITIICMIIINRILLKKCVYDKLFQENPSGFFGKIKENKGFDFLSKSKYIIITATIIILISLINIFKENINLGIDFSGGTNISMISENKLELGTYAQTLEKYDVENYAYYIGTEKEGYIKLNKIVTEEQSEEIKKYFENNNIEVSINQITTRVTSNLIKNAAYSMVIASVVIILYIALRFNINYSISAIIALFHDVLIMIAIILIFKIQINFILIASLLTIIGYSINDTIIVFDKVRSILKKSKKESKNKNAAPNYYEIINESLNGIISRNIVTSITTLIGIFTLIVLGVNEIYTFNISTLVGLVSGTFSSIFISPYILYKLENIRSKRPKKSEKREVEELEIRGINS